MGKHEYKQSIRRIIEMAFIEGGMQRIRQEDLVQTIANPKRI